MNATMLQDGVHRLVAKYGVDAVLTALAAHFDGLDAEYSGKRTIYRLHAITLRAAAKRTADDMRTVKD